MKTDYSKTQNYIILHASKKKKVIFFQLSLQVIFHWLDVQTSRDVIISGFIFKNTAEERKPIFFF